MAIVYRNLFKAEAEGEGQVDPLHGSYIPGLELFSTLDDETLDDILWGREVARGQQKDQQKDCDPLLGTSDCGLMKNKTNSIVGIMSDGEQQHRIYDLSEDGCGAGAEFVENAKNDAQFCLGRDEQEEVCYESPQNNNNAMGPNTLSGSIGLESVRQIGQSETYGTDHGEPCGGPYTTAEPEAVEEEAHVVVATAVKAGGGGNSNSINSTDQRNIAEEQNGLFVCFV